MITAWMATTAAKVHMAFAAWPHQRAASASWYVGIQSAVVDGAAVTCGVQAVPSHQRSRPDVDGS
jgi:hypothetical protein